MPDLSVNIGGLKLRTPFIIASGPYQGRGDRIQHCVDDLSKNYWAGIVTKTYGNKEFERFLPRERPCFWTSDDLRGVAMQNRGPGFNVISPESLAALKASANAAHEKGLVVIGSIGFQVSLGEWQEAAAWITQSGVDAVELNMSCPVFHPSVVQSIARDTHEKAPLLGYMLAKDLQAAVNVISTVRQTTYLPIFVKLPPQDLNEIVAACKKLDVAGVTLVNTIRGLIGVDIEAAKPIPTSTYGKSFLTGLSGPLLKPIALRVVAEVSSSVDIPIFGVGGISKWQDVVEYMMVGATAVQVCTGFMWKGFRLGAQLHKGLTQFMERKGYQGLGDFRGKSLGYFKTGHQASKALASIDGEKCTGCGLCATACSEASYGAIVRNEDHYSVNIEKCDGCGLCRVVCRPRAISLSSA